MFSLKTSGNGKLKINFSLNMTRKEAIEHAKFVRNKTKDASIICLDGEVIDALLSDDGEKEYKVHAFWGTELARAVEEGDYEEALRAMEQEIVEHTVRTFATEAERDAYFQGIADMDGWNEYFVYPESYGEPIWITEKDSRIRFLMRAEMPSYIIPVAVNATTPEEYVAYHGPQGQEDIDNYLEWIKEEVKPLLKSNEHQICFMYEQGNVENPDSSFDSTPIFGKACDVIPMLIFAFRD